MKPKQTVGLDEVLATYSAHLSEKYPAPERFRERLDRILDEKRGRETGEEYAASLERNIVFLSDLIVEGEALLDLLLEPAGKGDAKTELNELLHEMEERVHAGTEQRYREAFIRGKLPEFKELYELKVTADISFVERLEFNYRYLMALKILLFEFLSVLDSVRTEHRIAKGAAGAGSGIMELVKLTANYYIGNISIEESDGGRQ